MSGYARYERWLAARNLHLTYVKEGPPAWPLPFGPYIALAEREGGSYGYAHGYTPREAVAELCRTVRAHERAKQVNPGTFWTGQEI